jgi:hypothetical protein
METPTSAILPEIFLQHLEHNQIIHILQHTIIRYYRYVDDILIIYINQSTQIQNTLNKFNSIHTALKFTIVKEKDKKLSFST